MNYSETSMPIATPTTITRFSPAPKNLCGREKPKTFWIQNVLDPEQLKTHENIRIKNKTMNTLELPEIKMLWI
jgi:hypothetical protein